MVETASAAGQLAMDSILSEEISIMDRGAMRAMLPMPVAGTWVKTGIAGVTDSVEATIEATMAMAMATLEAIRAAMTVIKGGQTTEIIEEMPMEDTLTGTIIDNLATRAPVRHNSSRHDRHQIMVATVAMLPHLAMDHMAARATLPLHLHHQRARTRRQPHRTAVTEDIRLRLHLEAARTPRQPHHTVVTVAHQDPLMALPQLLVMPGHTVRRPRNHTMEAVPLLLHRTVERHQARAIIHLHLRRRGTRQVTGDMADMVRLLHRRHKDTINPQLQLLGPTEMQFCHLTCSNSKTSIIGIDEAPPRKISERLLTTKPSCSLSDGSRNVGVL